MGRWSGRERAGAPRQRSAWSPEGGFTAVSASAAHTSPVLGEAIRVCECLRGAEALREVAPGRGVGMTARQRQDDAPDRADDADADGQHGLPEAGRLRVCAKAVWSAWIGSPCSST